MKKVTLILGLLLLFSIGCQQDSYDPGTKQSYQARSNRLGGNSDQVPATTGNQNQVTGSKPIYVVAGTAKTEMAAIQAAQKFYNFGFDSNVFRAPNGTYVITVASAVDQGIAEQFLKENIRQGKISEHSALSFGENWVGPIYAQTKSVWQTSTTQPVTPTTPTENQPQNIYIPPSSYSSNQNAQSQNIVPTRIPGPQTSSAVDAISSASGMYYLVISEVRSESQAMNAAQQYIQAGLTVFVYETTSGYAVTLSQAVSRANAESIRSQFYNQVPSVKLVPDGPEWKRQIFP